MAKAKLGMGFEMTKNGQVNFKSPVFYDEKNGRHYVEITYSLYNLAEINVVNPKDGQVLTYDLVKKQWVNADPATEIDYDRLVEMIVPIVVEQIGILLGSDWSELDPESPQFIKNKPFKTLGAEFTVGSDGVLHVQASGGTDRKSVV